MNGISRNGDDFCLAVSTSIYSLDAIKKAAYRFADKASVIVQPQAAENVSIIFNFAGARSAGDPEQVISDFCNELLDQDLREIIKRETTPVRNLILAHAFSRTLLIEGD